MFINSAVNGLLPNSDSTIQTRILRLLERRKKRICHILQGAISSVHYTCDAWTPPNHLDLLGVVPHLTGEDGLLQSLIIVLREIKGAKKCENKALIVNDILGEYQIFNNIGFFVLIMPTPITTLWKA